MPIDTLNTPAPENPSAFEVVRAAQEMPVERAAFAQTDVDETFATMTEQPELHELGVQAATSEAQRYAQAAGDVDVTGRFNPTPETVDQQFAAMVSQPEMQQVDRAADVRAAVDGYRLPTDTAAQTAEAATPASPEASRYSNEQAKAEVLNAGDAVMRVRRQALEIATQV